MDPFNLDEVLAEAQREEAEYYQQYYAAYNAYVAAHAAPPPPRPISTRRYISRDREGAHQRLVNDYFADEPRFPADFFRRRFRMSKRLFLRIVETLEARDPYFKNGFDATGRASLTPLQKCTSAIRQLATGLSADMFDEYLHVGESTGVQNLKKFCVAVREAFGGEFLRAPTTEDCQRILQLHEIVHGFPGMLGSIDCMHWRWKNCPVAWRGQHLSGHKGGGPTLILEAVADYRLWIWHANFGMAGSNNDLNVLYASPLFRHVLDGVAPAINFTVNGRQYHMGYYLADGIYPRWPTFVKTLNMPQERKRINFAKRQESARKDIERAFGVLQARFNIVKTPSRQWYQKHIGDIMYTCIILHNMIIDDEGPSSGIFYDEDEAGSSTASSPTRRGVHTTVQERNRTRVAMRDAKAHIDLQEDLVEHLWAKFGDE